MKGKNSPVKKTFYFPADQSDDRANKKIFCFIFEMLFVLKLGCNRKRKKNPLKMIVKTRNMIMLLLCLAPLLKQEEMHQQNFTIPDHMTFGRAQVANSYF